MSDYSKLSKIISENESKLLKTLNDEQKKYYKEIMYLLNKKTYILLTDFSDKDVELSRNILLRLLEDDLF